MTDTHPAPDYVASRLRHIIAMCEAEMRGRTTAAGRTVLDDIMDDAREALAVPASPALPEPPACEACGFPDGNLRHSGWEGWASNPCDSDPLDGGCGITVRHTHHRFVSPTPPCLLCSREKPWGTRDPASGIAVCADCRNAAERARHANALPEPPAYMDLGHDDEISDAFEAYDRLVRWEEHDSRLDAVEPFAERAAARGRIIAMVANFAADALSNAPALPEPPHECAHPACGHGLASHETAAKLDADFPKRAPHKYGHCRACCDPEDDGTPYCSHDFEGPPAPALPVEQVLDDAGLAMLDASIADDSPGIPVEVARAALPVEGDDSDQMRERVRAAWGAYNRSAVWKGRSADDMRAAKAELDAAIRADERRVAEGQYRASVAGWMDDVRELSERAHEAEARIAELEAARSAFALAISQPTPYRRARSDGQMCDFWHAHNDGVPAAVCVGCRVEYGYALLASAARAASTPQQGGLG